MGQPSIQIAGLVVQTPSQEISAENGHQSVERVSQEQSAGEVQAPLHDKDYEKLTEVHNDMEIVKEKITKLTTEVGQVETPDARFRRIA